MSRAGSGERVIHIGGVPNEKQAAFFAAREKFVAYGGARGGGKSWALRRKLVGLCLCYPGICCLLLRRTLTELKANHIRPLLEEYGAILSWNAGEMAFVFANGSRILCGYCSCDRDLLRYQGQEYDIIAIDEATQLREEHFCALGACLRGVRPFPRRMYLTCNPGGVGHAWVKRLFIDRCYRAGEKPKDYRFIAAQVWDNKVLLASDEEYVQRLQSLPDRLRAAWLDGRWDVFDGQFFPEFNEQTHVFDGSVPVGMWCFGAMDYGFDRLVFLLLSEGEDGSLTVWEELCASGLTLGEAACRVAEICRRYTVSDITASPDLWNRRQDSGRAGIAIMQEAAALPPMRAADNRRIAGWRVLREHLHGSDGRAPLRVARQCHELISCMQALLCDPRIPEDAADTPHAVTHAPEALRYAVMSRTAYTDAPAQTVPFRFAQRGDTIWD